MINAKNIIILSFIMASTSASAQAAVAQGSADQPNYVMCRNQKTVRTLRIEKDDSKQCVALYTKAGVDKEVGRGQNFSSCTRVVANIRTNLDKAGWKCKEVSNAGMTSAEEDDN
jgi:hypothetical protein